MASRVTQGMMQSQLLRNITTNMSRMNNSENQLASGKKINKPSDDPVGITYALRYRSELASNDQYQRNIDSATSAVEHTDTVLGQINEVLQRANELTVKGLNGTNPQNALDAISSELGQLYEEAVNLGNDQFNGKYTFNGQQTDVRPYTIANATTKATDTGKINIPMGAGITIPVNSTGNEVFGAGSSEPDNVFAVLKGLQSAFSSGNLTTASSLLTQLSGRMDKFLQTRSEVGAKSNRIGLMNNRSQDLNLNLTSLSSKTEDADIAEVATKLNSDQAVYQASLSTGAKIIQKSLVDYM
jgi:flagellar hook-associated protein 3 FlgL